MAEQLAQFTVNGVYLCTTWRYKGSYFCIIRHTSEGSDKWNTGMQDSAFNAMLSAYKIIATWQSKQEQSK
jgi:hypothetical protein